jgi:DEAD/DEAH box helicase domain-containing protein
VDSATERLTNILRNEIGTLRALDESAVRRLLLGLLTHLRHQGGILQAVLENYVQRT